MPDNTMLTYLTDTAEPPPAVGDAVVLRVLGGNRTVAFSSAGRRLGELPRAECAVLEGLLEGHDGLPGQVSALVPRPGLAGPARIHLRLFAA